ncbi:MAG: hypothetical protein HY872_04300 [Chloroflexi bacterium]|nr:hypothetical protein [Chloroflexota bacterium]
MPTPYDGKIYLVQVKGSFLPRRSLGDVSRMLIDSMPNADGVFLQTSQGKEWQSKFDSDPKAVTGPDMIRQWVAALDSRGLETHVWGIPHGLNAQEEANRFIEAAKVPGVKSLGLDVEHGDFYYRGSADTARQIMTLIRNALGPNFHIALILDARANRPLNVFVDPWLPFVDSLHPMVYPKDFGRPVAAALDGAFAFLKPYNKPVVPMLQSYNGASPADITLQGNEAFKRGGVGISYFCLGDRHMNSPEFAAVAAVQSPAAQQQKTAQTQSPLPAGAVGRWPDEPRGYLEFAYEQSAARPWHDFRDVYGRGARWKLTSRTNDVAVAYSPQLPAPGKYSVDVYIPADNANSKRADYHVVYYENGQRKERQIKVDQSAHNNQWVSLGIFDLDPRLQDCGRVNVTDFSDEQPPQPVAFAGVRWVPVAATTVTATAGMSQAQLLAQQGPQGAAPQKTTAAVAPTAPTVVSAPPTVGITNQDMINAFIVVAARFKDKFTDLIAAAGLNSMYDNRKAVYAGPAMAALPNLSADRKAALADALRMTAADLARAATAASQPVSSVGVPVAGTGKADGRTWGLHGSAGFGVPPRDKWDFWIGELKGMGIKWYKQCDNGGADYGDNTCFRWVLSLRDAGITPVVRYQNPRMFPNRLESSFWDKMNAYVKEGIKWAEMGNEPNLPWEWQVSESFVNWNNADCIRAICEVWLADAEEALRRGARPAWYPFAPTDWQGGTHGTVSGPKFQELCWKYIGTHARDRARAIFKNGGWMAVHVAVYEFPLDHDPFKHGVGGGAPWDMCLRGYEIPVRYIQNNIGLTGGVDFPIMSTESGVFTPESHSMEGHQRLPNDQAHADLTLKMFDWLETNSPLQAMMPWCIAVNSAIGHAPPEYANDGWYVDRGGLTARTVVAKLKQTKQQRGQ